MLQYLNTKWLLFIYLCIYLKETPDATRAAPIWKPLTWEVGQRRHIVSVSMLLMLTCVVEQVCDPMTIVADRMLINEFRMMKLCCGFFLCNRLVHCPGFTSKLCHCGVHTQVGMTLFYSSVIQIPWLQKQSQLQLQLVLQTSKAWCGTRGISSSGPTETAEHF